MKLTADEWYKKWWNVTLGQKTTTYDDRGRMVDIVERLRAGRRYSGRVDPVKLEAAAEIERLRDLL